VNSKERTLEDKITLTYFPEGGACIDLSKLGISLNDENTLFEWIDWMQHQTIKNSYERIIELLEDKLNPITYEQHECVSIDDVIAAIN
jgi:hypothetical protein